MTTFSRRALYWAPRALCIAFILFISMFALDSFVQGRSVWANLAAFGMHLIPTYVLIAMLAVAWRWEWVGTAVCAGLGLLFLWWDANYRHNVPIAVLIIAGPLFLLAALFLLNWLKRTELRAGR